GRAAWLILSGERIGAAQAESWGLVEFVVDELEAGIDRVARTLAEQSPFALREIKRLLLATRDRRSNDEEVAAFYRCLRSEEGRAAGARCARALTGAGAAHPARAAARAHEPPRAGARAARGHGGGARGWRRGRARRAGAVRAGGTRLGAEPSRRDRPDAHVAA